MTYKNMALNAPYASAIKGGHADYLRTVQLVSPWCRGSQFESITFDVMHLIFLGIAKNHVPSCLKILKVWGFHWEQGETNEKFLKRVSLEMKQNWKRFKLLEHDMGSPSSFY